MVEQTPRRGAAIDGAVFSELRLWPHRGYGNFANGSGRVGGSSGNRPIAIVGQY